jgi:hypothetical protein
VGRQIFRACPKGDRLEGQQEHQQLTAPGKSKRKTRRMTGRDL